MWTTDRGSFPVCGRTVLLIAWFLIVVIGGCKKQEDASKTPIQRVTAAAVIQRSIPEFVDYVGTTEAVRSVDIMARVEGFLQSQNFVDGADVKKGSLLFVIDPKPFEAALESARGQLAQDQAQLAYAREQVKRYGELVDLEYIPRNTYDDYVTQAREAQAAVETDRGTVKTARLNLGYTRMYAPFDGRMGRRLFDVGNLVGTGEDTKLAVLVQLDPIYVYFSPNERELPRILRQQHVEPMTVTVFLADQSEHPYKGKVDFVDNAVDTSTGTVTLRAVIPNPDKLLLPGQFARVRLLLSRKSDALLVPEKAVREDQTAQSVFVVDKDNKVEKRDVVALSTWQGMRVIESGLKAGERVIIEGQQKVRPGMKVKLTLVSTAEAITTPSDDQ